MHPVRHPLFVLPLLATAALLAGPAVSQTAVVAPAATSADEAAPSQRIERITNEDALTRVDELRVGGETRSITVQPKNGAPAYDVAPAQGNQNAGDPRTGSAGKSRWRLLNF